MAIFNAQKHIDDNFDINCPHCRSEQVQMGGTTLDCDGEHRNIAISFVCTMCYGEFAFRFEEGSNNSVRALIKTK